MKTLISILIILVFPLTSLATGQAGDIIIWKGDTLTLYSNPLELREDIELLRPKLFNKQEAGINTACWRGYIAEWTIIEDIIYLTNIFSCNYRQDSIKTNLFELFGTAHQNGKVKASWVTGDLLIPKGTLIHYVHSGYGSFYETEIILGFENGKLTKEKEFDNSKSHKSIFSQNQDSLWTFVYSNINWEKIPNLDTSKVKVFISIKSGVNPKPDSVKIIRGADNEIFNIEAVRVIKSLPDWDVYYKKGKPYAVLWTLPIIFDEEKREQYAR